MKPVEIYEHLRKEVLGQEETLRFVSVAIFKHLQGEKYGNLLLIGNSGTGKTTVMRAMERLYQEFKDKNFVVFAVSVKDRRQDAIDFAKELKLTYPVALDPEGQVGLLYGAWGLPTTYLIGQKGEGLARAWGPAEWYSPAARNLIKELLDGKR